MERQKLVYILNRDAKANLTISSPLEAHKNYSICFAITGIDVGFEVRPPPGSCSLPLLLLETPPTL